MLFLEGSRHAAHSKACGTCVTRQGFKTHHPFHRVQLITLWALADRKYSGCRCATLCCCEYMCHLDCTTITSDCFPDLPSSHFLRPLHLLLISLSTRLTLVVVVCVQEAFRAWPGNSHQLAKRPSTLKTRPSPSCHVELLETVYPTFSSKIKF